MNEDQLEDLKRRSIEVNKSRVKMLMVKSEFIIELINMLKNSNKPLPIESAPKDGTLIDVFVGNKRYTNCRFNKKLNNWEYVNVWIGTTRTMFSLEKNDAKWLPIPQVKG